MRAINLVTHCLACEGMDENNLKKYNLCESHSEKSNVRKDEEKDLKRFVSNSNFNSFLLYEYYFWKPFGECDRGTKRCKKSKHRFGN